MHAFLLQLLLRALPLLGGIGGTVGKQFAMKGLGRVAPGIAGKLSGSVPSFITDIMSFAGGEMLAEQIPGTSSTGEGFLERLPILAAGFGGGRLAQRGLSELAGRGILPGTRGPAGSVRIKPGTPGPRIPGGGLTRMGAEVGGFFGGSTAAMHLLPGSEREDESQQQDMLLGSIDTASPTSDNESQFMDLLRELQFQSDEEEGIDPMLIQQILASAGGGLLV